jgi:hypothetical protein
MVHQWFRFTRTNAARNEFPWSLPAKGVIEFRKLEETRSRSISLLSFSVCTEAPRVLERTGQKHANSLIP